LTIKSTSHTTPPILTGLYELRFFGL